MSLCLRECILFQIVQKNLVQHTLKRGFLYSWKKGINRDTIAWLQQPIDLSPRAIRLWLKKRQWQALVADHSYFPERHQTLGPDLSAAHFVVSRDGAVKFEGIDRWIRKNANGKHYLPSSPQMNMKLEAIDASNTQMMYTSFDNFYNLECLKYLNLSNCPHIDDWCLDRFVQFRDTLLVLDLSGCSGVTERGLATLHKLHNLRRLILHSMPNVKYLNIIALMLEEAMPNCVLEGVDYMSSINVIETEKNPAFLTQWEDYAHKKHQIRILAAENDGTLKIMQSFSKKSNIQM